MDLSRLDRGEVVAMAGGLLLAISIFLPWFSLGNDNATLFGYGPNQAGLELSAWDTLTILRFLLLLGALAPFILAWIVVRGHALSWPRGELTAVVALVAITLVLVRGFVSKPGQPPEEISLEIGWWLALVASILILVGAFVRTTENEPTRKPPGVL